MHGRFMHGGRSLAPRVSSRCCNSRMTVRNKTRNGEETPATRALSHTLRRGPNGRAVLQVPGIMEWPAMIQQNSATWHPAYVRSFTTDLA